MVGSLDAFAAAAWLTIYADKSDLLPVPLDQTFRQATMLGAVALSALWIASIGSTSSRWASAPMQKLRARLLRRAETRSFRDYIPFMTERERAIIAQLLHQNRKTFTGARDGGYATTLIAKGYIRIICAPGGQYMSEEDVPFAIPDHLWNVAVQSKNSFPYDPTDRVDAWRVPWMVR